MSDRQTGPQATGSSGADPGPGALAGVRVVELGAFVSAAYAGKVLADLGAEVIKVEPPAGDATRGHGPFPGGVPDAEASGLFLYLNANKLGVTLDPRLATGRELLDELLERADILICDLPVAQVRALGLGEGDVESRHPGLVAVAVSCFGHEGPLSHWQGADIVSAAIGGMNDTVGEPGRPPLALPCDQSHLQAGAHAAAAALVGLFARRLTGRGQSIDIAESDIWASYNQPGRAHIYVHEGRVRRRGGHRTMGVYPYTVLPVQDGYLSMIAGRGRQWKRFLELVGDGDVPEWYSTDERFADRLQISRYHADEMDGRLAPFLESHTKQELFTESQARGIPFAPVYDAAEVVADEHLQERGYFVEIDHPVAGPQIYPGAPYQLSDSPWAIRRRAPLLGEHNREIYCERLGVAADELTHLRRCEVI